MATLNAVVISSKAVKGGKNKVRISVAHNGQTRYIVTDIVLNSNSEFKNGHVVKRPDAAMLNVKVRKYLQYYQSVLDGLEYTSGLTCPELVYQLLNAGNSKHRTLQSIFDEYITYARIKPSTAKCYRTQWNCISRCINGSMLAENVTHATILSLDKQLRSRAKPSTVRIIITFLRTLLNYAKGCGYVQFRVDPFFRYKLPPTEIRQSWLSVDEVKQLRDMEITNKWQAKARDIFMLSYYLGGINLADLLEIDFNKQTDTIRYIRKKTELKQKFNKYVEFDIPDEAKEIIGRYKDIDGHICVAHSKSLRSHHNFVKNHLRNIANATGINQLIYYSARKSFSQHAFNLGIGTSVIDYILGHKVNKGGTSLYAYISVTPEMATRAVRQVLDNLK